MPRRRSIFRRCAMGIRWAATGATAGLLLPTGMSPAPAATKTWTDGNSSALWNSSGNWFGGIPGSADVALFPSPVPHAHAIITLSNGENAAAIGFSNNYLLTGGTLVLGSSTGVNVDSGFTSEIDTPLGGTSGLTKVGAGKLVLGSASNAYTGGVTINGGTLAVSADANLGNGANSVSISSAATLSTSGTFSTSRTLTNGGTGATINTASGTLTVNSALPANTAA